MSVKYWPGGKGKMSKQKWINLVSVYSIIYTVITLLNSVLYLCNGNYEDPSGNWHELDRAIMKRSETYLTNNSVKI